MGSVPTDQSGRSSSSESSSGGLRFGQKIYFEDGSVSGNGSSKNRVRMVRCQVDGCRVDLSNAKAYFLKHKVCCVHFKSSKVIVSGLHQRFCQKCNRFHQLYEFDLEKRNCRKGLACHNERRRKPQQAMTSLLTSSRYSRLVPSLYGRANTSILGDSFVWPTTARSVQASLPHELMNVFSHGRSTSFTRTCPSTDSSCALSLLSNSNSILNQQTPTNVWQPSSMAQSPPVSIHHQYMDQTWEFMDCEKSNSHHMSPVLRLIPIPKPADFQIRNNGNTRGGFELSLHQQILRQSMEIENTRAHDSSTQHFHWSL